MCLLAGDKQTCHFSGRLGLLTPYRSIWNGTLSQDLMIYPDVSEILAEEGAGRDVPASELRRCRDNSVPPQQWHRVSLIKRVPFEGAHDSGALARIRRHRRTNKEGVQQPVGRRC